MELPGLRVLLSLDLKGKVVGRQEMPDISNGAELLRDEHWAESQGSESWSCSALNLPFDLGLILSLP